MVYSTYTQQQILYFYRKTKPKFYLCLSHLLLQLTLPLDIAKGFKSTTIVELLRKEGVNVKVCTVCQLLKKYRETGSIAHRPGTYTVTVFTVTYLSSPRSGFLFSGSLFSLFHPSLVAECCFFLIFFTQVQGVQRKLRQMCYELLKCKCRLMMRQLQFSFRRFWLTRATLWH